MSPKGTANSPDYHPERRSAPLVSQNDLFQQCKTEADENSRQHQSQPRTRRDYDDDQSQNRTRGRAMKSDREVRSGSASSSKRYDTGKHPGEHQEGTSSKVGVYQSQAVRPSTHVQLIPDTLSRCLQRTEK